MVQSKGYHTMNNVSWFFTMRIVDWTIWKQRSVIVALMLYFRVSGIHPAAVKCPVSASLVGRSSHVKLSVRSIARSICLCWNLIQRNQTDFSGTLNVEKQSKDSKMLWISCCVTSSNKLFANKILKIWYWIFCLVRNPLIFRCYTFLYFQRESKFATDIKIWYLNDTAACYVRECRCLITLANELQ